MLAKNKFRESWIRIKRLHTFAELSFPIQPFTICYAYAQSDITEKHLNKESAELLDNLYDAICAKEDISNLFGSLPMEFRKGMFESEAQYVVRIEEAIDFIESSESLYESEFKGQMVETYFREGNKLVPVRFFPDEYTTPSKEIIDVVFDEDDFMMKINNELFFEQPSVKNQIHYVRTRGIPEDKARKWCATNAKDAVWFKPKEGVLFNFCRKHEVHLPDDDYCKEFHDIDF